MFISLPNSYVELLISQVMVFGRRAFGSSLGHEGRVLVNRISAPIKDTPQSSLDSSIMGGHSKKFTVCNSKEGLHQNPTMLALLPSRTVRKNFYCL